MRRITKLGSISLAAVIVVSGLLALDLFTGAEAAPDAPLLYKVESDHPVPHVAYAQAAVPDGPQLHAHVERTPQGDILDVRPRGDDSSPLWRSGSRNDTDPWEVTRLAISRDGTSVAAGTADGRLIYLTSDLELFDTFTEFSMGSPTTGLAFDSSGEYLTVATYHGDLYLFGRTHHTTQGGYLLHIPAPLPAGALPDPGTNPGPSGEQGDLLREILSTGRGTNEFTTRPWSHVALAGQSRGAGAYATQGLFLVAATAYGEIYTWDLGQMSATGGAPALQPSVHRLQNGPCTQVATPLGDLELPCSKGALDRLVDALPIAESEFTDSAIQAVEGLSNALAREIPLEAVLATTGTGRELPLSDLDVTRGLGDDGDQLIAAALSDGTLETLRVSASSSTQDPRPRIESLWTTHENEGTSHVSLSTVHRDGDVQALLATASRTGHVRLYRVPFSMDAMPSPHLEVRVETASANNPLTLLQIAAGEPDTLNSSTSGRYLFAGTQDGRMRLYQTRELGGRDSPRLVWDGSIAVPGGIRGAGLLDTGGVIASGNGIAVYASLVTLAIDAPENVDRHQTWRAEAQVDAPDTQVETILWKVEAVDTKTDVDPVTAPGSVFEHAFTREGDYRVTLTVKDDMGVEVTTSRGLTVGGKNPVVKIEGPSAVSVGQEATFDFQGTHDPMLPEGSGHGIQRIDVHPYGDSRMFQADTDTLSFTHRYEGPTGVYRVVVTAYNQEERSTRTHVTITVTAPGFTLVGETDSGPNRLEHMVVSRETGHSVAFGGDGGQEGRLVLRDGDAELLHMEGTAGDGIPDGHFESGAITPDGSLFIGGRTSGKALRIPMSTPQQQTSLDVFDTDVAWTFVSKNGDRALFVDRDGRFAAGPGNLSAIQYELDTQEDLVQVVADERLIHVLALTASGEVLLVDGHRPDRGVRDRREAETELGTIAITPNLDPMGRAWAFLGGTDGTVETWRILGFTIEALGRTSYDPDGLEVHQIVPGRVDDRSRYTLSVTTTHDRPDCPTGDGRPCGRLFFTDSTGEQENGVPIPSRRTEVPDRPSLLLMDPQGERFLVASRGRDPFIYSFDGLWNDGPLAEMTGFGGRINGGGMTQDRAGHLGTHNGRHAWTFSPPTAQARVGPHDDGGSPQWGERIHVQKNVTLGSGPSKSGHGSIVAAEWDLPDETLEGLSPVHAWSTNGYKTVRLTITSRVTQPVETILIDRTEFTVPVYPRPPDAHLSAAPFNASADAVQILSGETVRFDASESHHPTGERIVDYRFRYGNGDSKNSRDAQSSYTYTKPGTYSATVVVADEHSSTDTSNAIRIEVENRGPEAAFVYAQPERDEPTGRVSAHAPVHFDASPSTDPDGSIVGWEWQFPDGTTSTAKTPTYSFSTTGDQDVHLRVKDDHGAWSPWLEAPFEVDTGTRLQTEQDPEDGSFISPFDTVTVEAFVHDLRHWPEPGKPVEGAVVEVKVYYDGVDGEATEPYETATYTTPADGRIEHEAGHSGTTPGYDAGKHRVMVVAHSEGVYGDIQRSETRTTTFRVEP